MRTLAEISGQKLRGGYYTPPRVVDACLSRLSELRPLGQIQSLLEPAVGDGAFLEGLARRSDAEDIRVSAVELIEAEAAKAMSVASKAEFDVSVANTSFFAWVEGNPGFCYDGLIGNPPFVRYQHVPKADRLASERILSQSGIGLDGVSNLWVSFVLVGLDRLSVGGVFSLVLPAELLSTASGAQVRDLLASKFDDVCLDFYPRSTFPDILQDVLVVSGRRKGGTTSASTVRFVEHGGTVAVAEEHLVEASGQAWTQYLLTCQELELYRTARRSKEVHDLGSVARLQVSIVTGANKFFTVPAAVSDANGLAQWEEPLLGRSQDSPGIVFNANDYERAREAGKRSVLLDFCASKADPTQSDGAKRYLRSGEELALHERYKCRIRTPWYRVPHVKKGSLMMSKRSHQHHRLIMNAAKVYTTDTIYRGDMTGRFEGREVDLVAGFHNSLTMLSAEVEGRSYGGGVLELVPSEIGRLAVPLLPVGASISKLDDVSRRAGGQKDTTDSLIIATNRLLRAADVELGRLLDDLAPAYRRLRARRLSGGQS